MLSDIEIAQAATMHKVSKVAQERLGIADEHLAVSYTHLTLPTTPYV